jgi:hypothetical protein
MIVAKFSMMEHEMIPHVGWYIVHLEEKKEKITIIRNDDSMCESSLLELSYLWKRGSNDTLVWIQRLMVPSIVVMLVVHSFLQTS